MKKKIVSRSLLGSSDWNCDRISHYDILFSWCGGWILLALFIGTHQRNGKRNPCSCFAGDSLWIIGRWFCGKLRHMGNRNLEPYKADRHLLYDDFCYHAANCYFAYWMEHSIVGVLRYFGIFVFIFAIIWIVQFVIGKRNVRKMNENLHHVKDSGEE